jgi:sugar (pentulose or hexulose) kinase
MGYAAAATARRAGGDVTKNLILGIDAGLTRTKAALFDEAGREVAAEGVRNEISRPFPGAAERSMDKAWTDAAKAIRRSLAAASANGADVVAVGVTGAMVGVWPVDDDGRPVRPAVLVADTRGQEAIDRAKNGDPHIMDRIFRSDGCVVEPGCTLPALRWLFDHEPAVMARARYVLTCKDWLRFRLTGELAADLTEAAVAPGDARARDRSLEMLQLFGLERHADLFPPVRPSESIGGFVTEAVAAETGLRAATPVAIGAGDVPCSAIAAGAVEPGMACTILGTTCHNGVVADEPLFEPPNIGLLFTLPDLLWLRVMVNLAGTPNLDWALWTLFREIAGHGAGTSVYADLERIAARRPAGVGGLLYHPYLSEVGLIAPVVAQGARAQFSGLRASHTREDLLRAVYEGVAYAIRDCYEAIGRPIGEIRLVGGGARSDFWSQMISDVAARPVLVPEGSELGAKGAALLASVAIGRSRSVREAVRAASAIRRRFEPNAKRAAVYADGFARYKAGREAIVALSQP